MSKKKKGIIAVVIIVVAAAVAVFFLRDKLFGGSSSGEAAYVESVADLTGSANAGAQNRYSGIVESQETWDVVLSSEQTVKEVFVEVGDAVDVGTELFEYDTEDLSLQLSTLQLELEEMGNEIVNYNNQIKALTAEKKLVSSDEQFSYTTQIQSLETTIKQVQYNQEAKKLEIQKLQQTMDQSVVTSKIAGYVKTINDSESTDYYGDETAFMSIVGSGDYRIKGTISENNVYMLTEGTPVIIRSRIDEEQTWTGMIETIDTENTESETTDVYYDGDSGESASEYPFYIALDSADGLMLGQHVYIEMDTGLGETKEGIWMFSSYIVFDEDGSTYCWADDGNGKLEKRAVELGEYDEDMDQYEITFGLTEEDLIAWPQNCYKEGMKTTQNYEEAIFDDMETTDEDGEYVDDGSGEYSEDEYMEEYSEDEYSEDEYMEDEYSEDEYSDEQSEDDSVIEEYEGEVEEVPDEDSLG